jgi:hypothetical protein
MSAAECPALEPRPGAHKMPAMETDTIIIGMSPFFKGMKSFLANDRAF